MRIVAFVNGYKKIIVVFEVTVNYDLCLYAHLAPAGNQTDLVLEDITQAL
jgi:hypothetical protein